MDRLMFYLVLAASIGSGLIAGAFFVFSVAVMPAFRRVPAEVGTQAMKRINEVILNPIFLGVFLGTAIVCLAVAALSMLNDAVSRGFLLAGSLLYIVGTFGVTIALNVPLNNALATSDDLAVWQNYLSNWTIWNHVRTVASTLSLAAFAVSLKAN